MYLNLFMSLSLFEGHPFQVRCKQDWGRGFILLLPQTAALPESDAGSGVIIITTGTDLILLAMCDDHRFVKKCFYCIMLIITS